MNKLEKPKKKIFIVETKSFDFNWTSKKVSLKEFLIWCKDIPPKTKDISLELREEWEYDNCITWLELSWKKEIINPNYEKELKKYNKKVSK